VATARSTKSSTASLHTKNGHRVPSTSSRGTANILAKELNLALDIPAAEKLSRDSERNCPRLALRLEQPEKKKYFLSGCGRRPRRMIVYSSTST